MSQSNGPVICFIDDDPVEVDVFKTVFGEDFSVIASTKLTSVLEQLESVQKRPRLFVLDLYFPKGRESSQTERTQMIKLRGKVEHAQRELSEYLFTIGQDKSGGIEILRRVREKYPSVPIVFYTRKGTLEDAIYCKVEGADDVLKKPPPENFDETGDIKQQLEEAALRHKDTLTREFDRLACTSGWRKIKKIAKFLWDNWGKF
jgi:CheY-like chemotaxis protein